MVGRRLPALHVELLGVDRHHDHLHHHLDADQRRALRRNPRPLAADTRVHGRIDDRLRGARPRRAAARRAPLRRLPGRALRAADDHRRRQHRAHAGDRRRRGRRRAGRRDAGRHGPLRGGRRSVRRAARLRAEHHRDRSPDDARHPGDRDRVRDAELVRARAGGAARRDGGRRDEGELRVVPEELGAVPGLRRDRDCRVRGRGARVRRPSRSCSARARS